MSFAAPLVLLALLAVPIAIWAYRQQIRRHQMRAAQFAVPALLASVAPARPGWRRHGLAVAAAVTLVLLILAAARPQHSVAVPLTGGQVMLVDDVSSSMAATDLAPSRLGAAERAAQQFVAGLPQSIRVGLIEFNQHPVVLQSPTTDHALARAALAQLRAGGRTAIGDAIALALSSLQHAPVAPGAVRPPSAIVLLSDGTSTTGSDPRAVARQAAAAHIPVYTVSIGTPRGTITVPSGRGTRQVPVPVDGSELGDIASLSHGRAFTATDNTGLRTVYAHLARQLGHKRVQRQLSTAFAGAGLGLLLLGSVLSLRWFGRLI